MRTWKRDERLVLAFVIGCTFLATFVPLGNDAITDGGFAVMTLIFVLVITQDSDGFVTLRSAVRRRHLVTFAAGVLFPVWMLAYAVRLACEREDEHTRRHRKHMRRLRLWQRKNLRGVLIIRDILRQTTTQHHIPIRYMPPILDEGNGISDD